MILTPKITPYSSTVGGGLKLVDQDGRVKFMVMICGIADGITKKETAIISEALARGIKDGVELPERAPV